MLKESVDNWRAFYVTIQENAGGGIRVKKLFIIMALLLVSLLAACSESEEKATAQDDSKEVRAKEPDENAGGEGITLPFDKNEFEQTYKSSLEDGRELPSTLTVDDESISLAMAEVPDVVLVLSAVAEQMSDEQDRNKILDLTDQMIDGIKEEDYYIGDLKLNGMLIKITAIDAKGVTLSINAR